MTFAIVCSALLGVLVFGLGFAVSVTRARTGTSIGYEADPDDPMYKIVRAHGNAAEYAAMLAVLMLLAGYTNPTVWVLWAMGIATACRYIHAAGLLFFPSLDQPNPARFIGALGTYIAGLMLCFAVVAPL